MVLLRENGFKGKESSKKYKEIMDETEETDYDKLNEIGDRAYEIMMKSSISTEKRLSLEEIMAEEVECTEIINKFRSIWCISLENVKG